MKRFESIMTVLSSLIAASLRLPRSHWVLIWSGSPSMQLESKTGRCHVPCERRIRGDKPEWLDDSWRFICDRKLVDLKWVWIKRQFLTTKVVKATGKTVFASSTVQGQHFTLQFWSLCISKPWIPCCVSRISSFSHHHSFSFDNSLSWVSMGS